MVDVLADGQAADVVLLDLTVIDAFTGYFVVATIDNVRQMRALIDALSKELARVAPGVKAQEEGTVESGWMLFDVGELIVHLFSLERRAYYNLEGLWSSAREVVRIQ
ncbi:MAG TPA: ribosome silencing factor [Dehalococcoidia bacterium]|nr:ribosome silencing factor [Dehalococcoidia bacterium]